MRCGVRGKCIQSQHRLCYVTVDPEAENRSSDPLFSDIPSPPGALALPVSNPSFLPLPSSSPRIVLFVSQNIGDHKAFSSLFPSSTCLTELLFLSCPLLILKTLALRSAISVSSYLISISPFLPYRCGSSFAILTTVKMELHLAKMASISSRER